MADRPILFSAPMVCALLAGTKTQTRRVLKTQPELFETSAGVLCDVDVYHEMDGKRPRVTTGRVITLQQLRYAKRDRLWVRESWDFLPLDEPKPEGPGRAEIVYWADADRREFDVPDGFNPMIYGCERFRPSIHMPRWASRLTLTVTEVRVQRLQDISEADAMAEGIDTDVWDMAPVARRYGTEGWFVGWSMGVGEPSVSVEAEEVCRRSYATLWDQINGTGSWAANPWVAAYSFTVERRNIDEAPHG